MLLAATPIRRRHPTAAAPTGRCDSRNAVTPHQPAATAAAACRLFAAGIIGGVITLLGAGGLQYAGLLPSPATRERRRPPTRRRWPR